VLCLATFISFFNEYEIAIASFAYIHPVYGGIQNHDLLDVSLLPLPLDQASRITVCMYFVKFLQVANPCKFDIYKLLYKCIFLFTIFYTCKFESYKLLDL